MPVFKIADYRKKRVIKKKPRIVFAKVKEEVNLVYPTKNIQDFLDMLLGKEETDEGLVYDSE